MAERILRAFWAILSPFVWATNSAGLCSYKWVNICTGARRPDLFDQLWHHQHYGTPIAALPDSVNLCGWRYETAVAEGTVTFVEGFTLHRITFDRDHVTRESLWYVTLPDFPIAASHVQAAYAWVCAVFGGSHEWRREPVNTLSVLPNAAGNPAEDNDG